MMILLEEIEMERGEIPKHLREKYNEAEAEFLKNKTFDSTDIDLLRDLYSEADAYLEEYLKTDKITCSKGCGHCCKQLICCTTLEMKLIVKYMSTKMIKTKRKELKKKLKKEGTKFAMWFQNSLFDIPKSKASSPNFKGGAGTSTASSRGMPSSTTMLFFKTGRKL